MNVFILLATVLSQLGGSSADRFVFSFYIVLIFADIFIIAVSTPLGSVCGMTSVGEVSLVIKL